MMTVLPPPPPLADRKRGRGWRGFNLIEAAIVLGVVGLVVGGIWVATTNMYENYRVNKTVEDVFTTARNIQNLISIRDSETIGNNVTLTQVLINAGSYPKDWVSVNGAVHHPFGGSVNTTNTISPLPPRFSLALSNIPNTACVSIIVKITAMGNQTRESYGSNGMGRASLGRISINWPDFGTQTFPVSMETAKTYCIKGNNLVALSFGYSRVN